jgi:isoquinoline 1-oxidoreductase subunit beta
MHNLRFPPQPGRTQPLSRRAFLKVSAAAGSGLTLGIYAIAGSSTDAAPAAAAPTPAAGAAPAATPTAFIRIAPDNTVTVISKHVEMGQGTYTGLPTLVAEELDASWAQIRVEGAPADAKVYANLAWGQAQGTGGSSAIANSFMQYRQAGAAARAMLVAAAAAQWKVAPDTIVVRNGELSHASGRKATFGQLAQAAAAQPVPQSPKLKDPRDFVYIGKTFARTDARAKSNGSAKFTQDVKLPDMLTALVAHPPRFGARVKSFDVDSVQGMPGVRYIVEVPNGVAVVGTTFWSVKRVRDKLKIEWDEASGAKFSSADIAAEFKRLAATPGAVARSTGDTDKALASGARTFEAAYEFPYLAHATMEPMNCVVKLTAERCEIWNGEQFQTGDQMAVAQLLGMRPEQVTLNQLFAGGSFGRRASSASDYVIEAVSIARAIAREAKATGVPVKLVWTREDDMRAGYFRPAYYHTIKAALDGEGRPVAWQQRIVGQSIVGGTLFESVMVKNGVDATSVDGAANLPYAIPNLLVDLHSPSIAVPVLWWRSVGSSHNAFSTEAFIDELAAAAGKDPVAYRRALLEAHPRHRAVLDLATEKAQWASPLAAAKPGSRRGRGVAVHESFNTVVAQVAEVTVTGDRFKVDRVVCAVDCGVAVNPDVVRAQMEGGIGFGLSAVLYGAITLKDGAVEQSNFHDYQVLRINEMPAVEVHIVPSAEKPTGVGEPGVPPIAPAVANALAAATGKRLRKLPLSLA